MEHLLRLQNEDGSIDRRALGKIAFASEKNLAFLQEIVHPVANRLTIEWVQEKKGKNCVVNAALLHESVLFDKLDGIIIVTAPFFTRLLRAKKRDGLSVRAVLQRFASQKNFFAQYRRANADIYRVGNFGLSFFDGFNGPCGVKRAKGLKAKLEVKIDAVLSAVEHSLKQRQGF
jgi:dephospho-CoA kinase